MHNDTDKLTRLRELAREAQNYQLERGLSDAKFCAEVAGLGSTKTYKRILDDADGLEELNLDTQLRNYESALEYIRALRAKDRLAEPEYDDFANILTARAAVTRAMAEESIARFVVIEGETATGKDAVKNALLKRWPKAVVSIDANELWRESLSTPTKAIFQALDIRRRDEAGPLPMPKYPAERLETIYEVLGDRRLIVIFNEGHHFGPRMLNVLKDMINRTKVVPVMLCIPGLLQRLVKDSHAEAIQLFHNRLCERVYLPTPPATEIGMLLERRGVKFADAEARNEATTRLAEEAPMLGNWRYVSLVARELALESRKSPVTLAKFLAAKTAVTNRRIPRQFQGRAA